MRRVYWWTEGSEGWQHPNFGDELVPLILEKASVNQFEWSPPETSDFVIAGSVLEHLPPDWTGTVCGAGQLHEGSRINLSKAKVLGVRGQLTLDRLSLKSLQARDEVVLGDPALLVPSWIRQYQAKWDLGVIPHWSDKELMKRYPYGHYIDVRKPAEEVVEDIAKCKRVISSSLHGLIVADAYGIPRQAELFPAALARVQHEGGDFKYRDYASIYDTHPHFGELWTAPRDKVLQIQHDLRVMFAKATETVAPPTFPMPQHRHSHWPCPSHRRHRRRPQVSLLVPFRDDQEFRVQVWEWLKQYWKHHLDSFEIVMGHDRHYPFSKTSAVNDAASRARGRIFIILDADTYLNARFVQQYVDDIDAALRAGKRKWFIPYNRLYRLSQPATEALIMTDPAHDFCIPSPPPPSILDNSELASHDQNSVHYGHQYGALIQMLPRAAFFAVGGMDSRFRGWGCTDTKTEIFTAQGWKNYQDVGVGDPVLTLNHETGLSEWKPVQKMNVYEGTHEMLSVESKTHSSLTTLNHRWPVIRTWSVKQVGRPGFQRERKDWATSEKFQLGDYVPIAAQCADLPAEPKYTDALVECVAWFWTEGHIDRLRDGRPGRTCSISQSAKVNPDKCELITSALTRLFGAPTDFPRRGSSVRADIPRWYAVPDRDNISFALNAEAGGLVQSFAPGRVPSHEFLLSLTQSQLALFIETSMLADGHSRTRSYERVLGQKNPAAADAFQFACVLAGHASASSTYKLDPKYGYSMNTVSIRQQRRFKLSKGRHAKVRYTGIVWCPTTENGTWLARRNGKVYFTGNSEDAAFMRAVDTVYCPHNLGDNDVIHLWHARAGMSWDTRRWVGQPGVANSRLSQRYSIATSEPGFMKALTAEDPAPKDVLHHWWSKRG